MFSIYTYIHIFINIRARSTYLYVCVYSKSNTEAIIKLCRHNYYKYFNNLHNLNFLNESAFTVSVSTLFVYIFYIYSNISLSVTSTKVDSDITRSVRSQEEIKLNN